MTILKQWKNTHTRWRNYCVMVDTETAGEANLRDSMLLPIPTHCSKW